MCCDVMVLIVTFLGVVVGNVIYDFFKNRKKRCKI
mgnify:CR=1 FL=1